MTRMLALLLVVGCQAPRGGSTESTPELSVHEVGEGRRVLVLLHGYGAAGDDLVPLGRRIARDTGFKVILPEAPIDLGGGRAWFHPRGNADVPAEVRRARSQLASLLARVHRDADVLAVGGFSQGAIMSADLALETDVIDGLVLFSGAALPFWSSARREDLPVLITHGFADQVLPIEDGRALEQAMEATGARVRMVTFEGGHTIPEVAIRAAIEHLSGVTAR